MGGHYLANDNFAVAVPEENLVRIAGVKDPYGAGYSVAMHEIAHAIYRKGLDPGQFEQVNRLYDAHVKTTPAHWTDSYAATNVQEYFAQSTNAYFNENAGVGHGGRAWLQENDPGMCALLDKVYGPRGDAAPTPTAAPARK